MTFFFFNAWSELLIQNVNPAVFFSFWTVFLNCLIVYEFKNIFQMIFFDLDC